MVRRITLLLFVSILVVQGFAQKKVSTPPPVFTVEKKPVTANEFIYLYSKNNKDRKEEFTKEKIEEYIDLLINFKLKVEEARRRGLDTTSTFVREFNSYREELRKPYLPDVKLIDSLVQLTYDRLKEEVRAAHILINLKPDASPQDTLIAYQRITELRNRIVSGGEDFSAVAAANSQEPNASISKGDLGYFTAMQMVFPFEQAAYQTPVGQVSMPVRTQFGYHIVKVLDRRPSRGEVEVSHLMLRTGEGFDNEKAKNAIFDLYDQLQQGASWNDVVREHSQDPSSKNNGGKLRPFGAGTMASVPAFEQAAFALKNPGDISDPVQTQFGWHILKLESKIPLPSLKEMEAPLKNRVSRDERAQISRQAIQKRMRSEFSFNENAEIKSKVIAMADSSLLKGQWKPQAESLSFNTVLFTMLSKPYSFGDFVSYLNKNQKVSAGSPAKVMEQHYNRYIEEVQGLLFEEKIKKQNPDFGHLLQEYYEGILLFEIMEKEVWNKASSDSIGQVKYYEANRSKYLAQERINATVYVANVKAQAEELKRLIDKDDSVALDEFVKKNKIRIEVGKFEKTERPVFAKIPWSSGLHSTENNNLHYVIKVTAIVPPGEKTFDEARAAIISDYQTHLEKQWVSALRKKYSVKVNKKGKQYVLDQLVKP